MRKDFVETFNGWKDFESGLTSRLQGIRAIVQNDPPPEGYPPEEVAAWETRARLLMASIERNFEKHVEATLAVPRLPEPPQALKGFDD